MYLPLDPPLVLCLLASDGQLAVSAVPHISIIASRGEVAGTPNYDDQSLDEQHTLNFVLDSID